MSQFNSNFANLQSNDQPRFQVDATLIKIFLNTVKEGDLQQIRREIEKYQFDVKMIKDSQYEQNALFYASLIKDDNDALNVMKFFVELGVNTTQKDKIQQTPLYYTAREGKYQCSKFLLEHGCPINEKDLYQQTPVYYAAREGRFNVFQLLVEHGADLIVEDKFGQSLIFYAIREGHYDIVEYLIKLTNKQLDKADKKGVSPYMFAIKSGKTKIAELLRESGFITEAPSHDKKSKSKKTKAPTVESVKTEEEPKYKKFVLVRVNESGEKTSLTPKDIEKFEKEYPDIFDLLKNPIALEKLEREAPEELKQFDSWEKQAKKLMLILWKLKDSEIFHRPVDPVELGIPDYHDIIKHPMDFTTIKKKLNHAVYRNCREFCDDMNLVFDNCILYNGERSVVGTYCNNLRNEYKKLFDQLNMSIFL